jgi:PAS domain S-box-containing protein
MLRDKEIRVLLIEDDEEDFILTRDYLKEVKQRNYNLGWVNSYDEGLKKIRKAEFDAYLVDYRLGGGTGVELISQALSEGSNAPFILLTGLGTPEIDEMAMKVGAADYLVKSNIDAETLDRSIRYSIRQYNLLQEVKMLHAESEKLVTERTWELAEAIKELEKTNRNLIDEMVARRIAKEEKEKSQKLYFTIGENYPNGFIAVFNKSLEYIFIEGQLLKDLAIAKEELIGKTFTDHFSSDSLNYINQNFQKAFNGERTVFEMFFNDRYLQSYALPLAEPDGQVKQVMLVTQDITERKKAIEEISNALEKEKSLNELKSRFVSMASHEFRTPLGTILSSVTLISKYNAPGDEDKRDKHISRIKSAVVNLTGILNDFLSLSKLEEGKTSYNPKQIDIREICEEVKEEMMVIAKAGQDIIIENKGDVPVITMDRQILKNILINLTSNAIKYSPEDENVYIGTEIEDGKFSITVMDRGIGIPREDQKHLFDTFFRAGNVTHIQGTGLGLNIVKKYVDMLDGSIAFESKPGKGTIFTINVYLENLRNLENAEKERLEKEESNIEKY